MSDERDLPSLRLTFANPINQLVLSHVLTELNNGNVRKVRSLGLSDDDMSAFQRLTPAEQARLAATSVLWVDLRVNQTAFRRLLDQAKLEEERSKVINHAIKLGATSQMMHECFGLTHSEVAQRRKTLGVEAPKGRPRELDEATEGTIWAHWSELNRKEPADTQLEQLQHAMTVAETLRLGLGAVWSSIAHAQSTE